MKDSLPFKLEDDVQYLTTLGGWDAMVYQTFMDLQSGKMTAEDFYAEFAKTQAVLVLDMTGFTATCLEIGELDSLLRVLNTQKVCIPVLKEYSAFTIRCFADDIVALFETSERAVAAALEIHRRIEAFNLSTHACDHPAECCIGIGYGKMLAIGPNLAQGEEMNKASKLGEDIARARETLITEGAYQALQHRDGLKFEVQKTDDQLFKFYSVRSVQ